MKLVEPTTTIGKNIERFRLLRGISKNDLCARAGIGTTTLNQIYMNAARKTARIAEIAAALDVQPAELLTDLFTLDTAVLCDSDYHLQVDNLRWTGIKDLPAAPGTLLIAPIREEYLKYESTLIWRPHGQQTAVFVTNYRVGSRFVRFRADEHSDIPLESQPSEENGQYLGIVAAIVSIPHLFPQI